jgi:hypothetical protein
MKAESGLEELRAIVGKSMANHDVLALGMVMAFRALG